VARYGVAMLSPTQQPAGTSVFFVILFFKDKEAIIIHPAIEKHTQ
jgi:hypothetical protein